jgi:HTH-type transcriptional regulator/antitoxin HipB
MPYPINTSIQLRAVLRALRQSCDLTQADVGQLLGVNQKRIARIENAPGVTSFDQIARLIAALGGRLVVETAEGQPAAKVNKVKTPQRKTKMPQGNW